MPKRPVVAPLARQVHVEDSKLHIKLAGGRQLVVALPKRLARRGARALAHPRIAGGGTAIHWDNIGEGLTIAQLLGITEDQVHNAAGFDDVGARWSEFRTGILPGTRVRKTSGATYIVESGPEALIVTRHDDARRFYFSFGPEPRLSKPIIERVAPRTYEVDSGEGLRVTSRTTTPRTELVVG